ncbi:NADH dehydrogenase subunit 6 (mitochondrion) [Saccoglossus kowalevskii]|uniref:NADH-ubiquinone oxidoreductase chain 6 n=1 Tax=Saccoglossus kowalevskii TaxID=10224 RepID=Q3L8T0_SACKO|nr:NADH dehydrogenase subunit 6 [Saccoglossus kowalevskii]AAQ92988.1 NADH dehydrogenase subunit 6 [Saccoglossus kowalevskii]
MSFVLCSLVFGGGVIVFMSRSPYFSALGLVLATCGLSGVLMLGGAVFVGLILFLMYLGGMLVVFAYSAALAADIYPEVGAGKGLVITLVGAAVLAMVVEVSWGVVEVKGLGVQEDLLGISGLYLDSWAGLLLGAFGLFVCLFVVLCLVRGVGRGALRAV